MKPQKPHFLAIAVVSVVFSLPAFAASGIWNTTTSGALWTLDTNWTGSVIADGSGNTADFSQVDLTADTIVALGGTRTIGNLIFGDTATGTAGAWTLNGAGVLDLAGTTPTITVNALGTGKALILNAGLSGTSGFTKNGSGTVILQSAGNTLSGAVTLSAGTLQLNNASLTNASSVAINSGTVVMATAAANALGGTISFGGGTLQYNTAPGTDYSAQFSTSANQLYRFVTLGGGPATFASDLASSGGSLRKDGGGSLTLSAANTFTGTTTVSNGNLVLSNALALQNSAIDAANSVTATASAGLVLSSVTTPTFGGLTGTKALASLFNTSTGAYGSVTNLTLNPGTGVTNTYSGAIADGAAGMSLTKTGAGTQVLTVASSYTGGTAINGGKLSIGNAAALGSTGTISFGGGTLQYTGITTDLSSRFSSAASQAYNVDTNSQNVTLATGLTSSGGSLTKGGTGILTLTGGLSNTFNGAIAVNGGRLTVQDGLSLKNSTGAITVASGASFDYGQNFTVNNLTNALTISGTGDGTFGAFNLRNNGVASGNITLAANATITHDYNIATVSGSITGTDTNLELKTLVASQYGFVMSGAISLGTGSLTLTGIGTVPTVDFALSGTNSFTGGTLLKGGRVSFNNASALGSGTVTFVSNTSLAGTANITHANALTVNSGITATLEAAASTALLQSGAVTGSGTFTKSGLGTVTLSGGLANTFSGPINVNAGTLGVLNGASIKNITGAITVAAGATFDAKQGFDANNFAQNISIAGSGSGISNYGALNVRENANFSGAVTLTANSKITHDYNNGTISGAISGTNTNLQLTTLQSGQPPLSLTGTVNLGTGGVTVTGAGGTSTVNLSGTLSYTGETAVTAGALKLSGTARLADSSTVRITSGAVLNLDFSGTDTVAALFLGASSMPAGTYGSLASSATNKSANFEGAGILSVGGAPAPSYSTWATANGITGQPASGDFDKDGLSNIVEYALGLSPTVSSVPAGTFNGSLLSFTKGTEAKANGDVTYEIEQSTTLGGWTVVVPNAPASATISYTLPTGQPTVFARLKITQIP